MRIAVITPYLVGKAGGERLALGLAWQLQKLGNHVEIFCYSASPETCYPEMMAKVKVNPVVPLHGSAHGAIHSRRNLLNKYFRSIRPYYELHMMRKLGRSIPHGFDAILCLNQPSEWAAYFAKKKLGIPAVWICNEPPFYHDERIAKGPLSTALGWPAYKVWDVKAARAMGKVIVLSRLYKKYTDKVYGISSKVEYIGIGGSRAKPSITIRRKFGIPKDSFVALFVGSFTDYKRPQDAIGAVASVPGATLILIGEGGEEGKYRALAEKLGAGDRVFFIRRVSEGELESFYQQCDCLIFTAEQSWGLVIPEAMLRGKPVITCPETGASEIVQDGKTGFIVAPRSPGQIAEKIALLRSKPALAKKVGAAAKSWVEKNLSQEEYARRIGAALKSALAE